MPCGVGKNVNGVFVVWCFMTSSQPLSEYDLYQGLHKTIVGHYKHVKYGGEFTECLEYIQGRFESQVGLWGWSSRLCHWEPFSRCLTFVIALRPSYLLDIFFWAPHVTSVPRVVEHPPPSRQTWIYVPWLTLSYAVWCTYSPGRTSTLMLCIGQDLDRWGLGYTPTEQFSPTDDGRCGHGPFAQATGIYNINWNILLYYFEGKRSIDPGELF